MKLDYHKYMKLNYLKEKKELISIALLGVSAIFAILILVKVTGFFLVSARAGNLARAAVEENNAEAKDTEKYVGESIEIANKLKRENLFAPPAPKQHPVKEVRAIFGDEVLINDRWYKVGQMVADAKIVAIEPTQVRIEWDGSEKAFLPIDASVSEEPGSRGPTAQQGGSGAERTDMVVVGSQGGQPMPDRSGAMGGRMMRRMENMSEQDRQRMRTEMRAMRERFMNASPEERERMREEMRARFGGGRPGRGRGGRAEGQ
jgi:hypothetical protein